MGIGKVGNFFWVEVGVFWYLFLLICGVICYGMLKGLYIWEVVCNVSI